jgi:acyl-CoA thioester hydrolase
MERARGVRLQASAYPHTVQIAPRFDDLDWLGHINNVSLTRIIEDARFRWLVELGLTILGPHGPAPGVEGGRFVTAATQHEYLAEAFYPEALDVRLATLRVGRSSWTIGHLARQRERNVCVGFSVLVLADAQGPVRLGERLTSLVEAYALNASGAEFTEQLVDGSRR